MAFFNFLKRKPIKKEVKEEEKKNILTIGEFVKEMGIARSGVIGNYESEENPDDLGPQTYIDMQDNDGEVKGIVRVLTLPIISTEFHILPAENDKGERDFIENVLTSPLNLGGMTTPLPFIIADMTRAIFEGFRLYEKVARVIESGKYKGKISWKKLAPRDARTVTLKPDKHGGFNGAHQQTTFGSEIIDITIPPEKCMLFTFQKEKHWLYGESILKTAFYHYDKKHKLYYISHKKAEIESTGLKILKISQMMTPEQKTAAEEVVDTIGINSRVTLPPGIELDIERGSGGYDPLPLIDHHNLMMSKSALTQAMDQVKYAYPYGKGTSASQYLVLSIESILKQMAATINTYAIAPLIDWNFGTQAYPYLKFESLSDVSQVFLREVFDAIMKAKTPLPEGFIEEIINETSKSLNLKWTLKQGSSKGSGNNEALKAFEKGKLKKSDETGIKAPSTPQELKDKLLRIKSKPDLIAKCYKLGEEFAYGNKKNLS